MSKELEIQQVKNYTYLGNMLMEDWKYMKRKLIYIIIINIIEFLETPSK